MAKNTKTTTTKNEISEFTPELQKKLPEFLKKFDKLCENTNCCDRPKAEQAIKDVYAALARRNTPGFETVPEFVWVEGLMEGAKLAAQVTKGDTDVTDEEIKNQAHYVSFGSMESYWIGIYDFINQYMASQKEEMADLAVRIVEECGPFWVFEGYVIMVERCSVLSIANGELHSTTGKALEFPNGEGLYAYKGQFKNSLIEVVMAERAEATNAGKAS